MKYRIYPICIFLMLLLNSQVEAQSWFTCSDNTSLEIGEKVIQTADQGFLVSGRLTTGSGEPGKLIKLDPNGNLDWVVGDHYRSTTDLHSVADGRCFVAGQIDDLPSGVKAIIAGYNSDGSLNWEKDLGYAKIPDIDLSGKGNSYGLVPTSDNHLLHYGTFEDIISNVPDVGVITKFDLAGNEIWDITVGIPDTSIVIRELFENEDGDFVFAASSSSDKTLLGKVGSNGNLLWSRQVNFHEPVGLVNYSTDSEFVRKLVPTPNGGALFGNTVVRDTSFIANDTIVDVIQIYYIGAFDEVGNIIFSNVLEDIRLATSDLITTDIGNLIFTSRRFENWGFDIVLKAFDPSGTVLFDEFLAITNPAIDNLKLFSDANEITIIGTSAIADPNAFNTINTTKVSMTGHVVSRVEARIPNSEFLRSTDCQRTSDGGYVLTGYYNLPGLTSEYLF